MKGQKGYVLIGKVSGNGWSLSGLWQKVVRWHDLAVERNQLARMSDDALKDIGLSRADVLRESELHFWQDPMDKGH